MALGPADSTPSFSPELLEATRQRLRTLLGPAWRRVESDDDPTRPDGERHLLAVVDQHAAGFSEDFRAARFPGSLPDFMALYLVVSILERMQGDPVLEEVRPRIHEPTAFRHDVLALGLADHLRLLTPYPVRLPTRSPGGERIVDLVVGDDPELDIEVKTPEEFSGPRRHVSPTDAFKGIKKAWRSAYGGANPQVRGDRLSALLVGGLTIEVATISTIVQRARSWLARVGMSRPYCWGILAMTFVSVSRIPAGRRVGDGLPVTVRAIGSVFLAAAKNPHYRGSLDLVLTPPQW